MKQEPEVLPAYDPGEDDQAPSTSQQQTQPAPTRLLYPSEYIKDTAKILFWEVINELVTDLSQEMLTDVNFKLGFSDEYLNSIEKVVVSDEIVKICEEVYDAEHEQHQRALKQEKEERRDRVAAELTGFLIADLVDQEALNLATIEIREVKAILKKQCIERVTVDINKELMEEVVTDMVQEVAEDVYETDVTKRLEELAQFEKIVQLSRAGRFLSLWKKMYTAVTKLKRAMQDFPSAANMDSAGQVRRLINVDDDRIIDKQFYVNKRALLTIESPMEMKARERKIESQLTVHALYQKLLHHTAWQPLDLSRVVGKILARRVLGERPDDPRVSYIHPVHWKLVLCLPETDVDTISRENTTTLRLCDWLMAKFSKGKTPTSGESAKSKVISLYKSTLPSDTIIPSHRQQASMGVCIRTVTGTLDAEDVGEAEEERHMLGTSGLVFVLPAGAPINDAKSPYWKTHRERLQRVLEVKPMYQDLPLVIIVPVPANEVGSNIQVTRCMAVGDLIERDFVCDVEVFMLETDRQHIHGINVADPTKSERVCESLQWMAECTRRPPAVRVLYLKDCLERVLLEHYYTPMQQNLKKRRVLGYLDQDPNHLLDLYNSVVGHIAGNLTADNLAAISWPVPEFVSTSSDIPPAHWNSEDHFEYLYDTLRAFALPDFQPLNADSEEWADVKRDLWQYVSMVTGRMYGSARTALYSRLKKLLKGIEEDFEQTCYLQEGEDNCEPTYINVPWSRLISLCIDYRFDTTDFEDPILQSSETNQGTTELRVAYDENQLRSFRPPADWCHIESEKSILETPSLEATVKKAVNKARDRNKHESTTMEISIVEDPHNVSQVSVEARSTSSSLIRSLQSERRHSDHFQKYLENALKGGEECDSSLNASVTGLDSIFHHNQSLDFTVLNNSRRMSFDATGYFHQSRNDISRIFDTTVAQDQSVNRRVSDMGTGGINSDELSRLYGKKRKERLSEIFNNDPVAVSLKQPTLVEDFDSFKKNLKSSRRESDLFEKRLQSLLTNTPMDTF